MVEGWAGVAWEALAAALSLTYLVLVIRQRVWAWPAAILGAAIYAVVMFAATLYMQAALQLFYIGAAAYGWWCWRRGAAGRELPVTRWPWIAHLAVLAVIGGGGLATGAWLEANTDAAFPRLDALTAWGAVVTTWMVARKVLENWYYWLVIDSLALGLYAAQGLWATVALFAVYLVLVVVGLRQWLASERAALA